MSLRDVIKSGVAVVNKVTKPLQPKIGIMRWTGEGGFGSTYEPSPTFFDAIIEEEQGEINSPTGELIKTIAHVMILEPITPSGIVNRREPLDERDVAVLPSGVTGNIVRISGFIDAKTTRPFFSEFWLG